MLAPRDPASAQLLRHCLELALLLHAGQAVPVLLECAAGVLESCGDCCWMAGGWERMTMPLTWSTTGLQSEIRDLRAKAEQMQKLAREMLAQSERVITLCNEVEAGVRDMTDG